ncbi:MAG: gluconolaconase [Burkholderiaceae bacterium]|nr:MAG: gluconolaconase [Burkholderiaceae bacterium]
MKRTSIFISLAALTSIAAGTTWWLQQSASSDSKPSIQLKLSSALHLNKPAAPAPTTLWEAETTRYLSTFTLDSADHKAGENAAPLNSDLSDPYGIALDANQNMYVSDAGEHNRILKIDQEGKVTVFAGSSEGMQDSSDPRTARFHTPSGLAFDKQGNLLVADTGNHAIRRISPKGEVTTLAGSGQAGLHDGPAGQAQFNGPIGLFVTSNGDVIVADTYNDAIRRISKDGMVTTIAGGTRTGYRDGLGSQAFFDTPTSVVANRQGEIIVADLRNHALRKISAQGEVTTLAISAREDREALMRRPMSLAITHDDFVYVGEQSHGRILQLTPQGELRGFSGVDIDIIPGDDTTTRILSPSGMALGPDGQILFADSQARQVKLMRAKNLVSTSFNKPPGVVIYEKVALPPNHMLWPVLPQNEPHEVVGTFGEVRGNYDGESRDHFHRGLDIQANQGEKVVAIQNEKIASPASNFGTASINEGFRIHALSYIHMKVGRDAKDRNLDASKFQFIRDENGKLAHIRIRRGTRFLVGEVLGSINQMNHVHLNYAPEGFVRNPLELGFIGVKDHIPPLIEKIYVADKFGQRLGLQRAEIISKGEGKGRKKEVRKIIERYTEPVVVSRSLEELNIIVDAYDQFDGNAERRRLGLYKLGYQVLGADGNPLAGFEKPLMTLRFDQLPTDDEAVKLLYAEKSGITVHGNAVTRFLYNSTHDFYFGQAKSRLWNIKDLAPGEYTIRIFAYDYAGNRAGGKTELKIRV